MRCEKHGINRVDNYCWRCERETHDHARRIVKLELALKKIEAYSQGGAYLLAHKINYIATSALKRKL